MVDREEVRAESHHRQQRRGVEIAEAFVLELEAVGCDRGNGESSVMRSARRGLDHLRRIDDAVELLFGHEAERERCGFQREVVLHRVVRDLRGLGPRLNKSDAVDSPELAVLEAITKWPTLMEHVFAANDPMRGAGPDFEAVLRVAGML